MCLKKRRNFRRPACLTGRVRSAIITTMHAAMAELVDAEDLKSLAFKTNPRPCSMQHSVNFIIFCDKNLSFQVDILHVGNFLPPFCPLHVGKHFGVCQHFANKSYKNVFSYAAMTELVDVSDLKSEAGFSVRVRFPLAAPSPKDSCDCYRRRFFIPSL